MMDNSDVSDGLLFFIFISIIKYFSLLFGLVSIIFIPYKIFTSKKEYT